MSGPHDLVRSSCFHETCSTLPSGQKEQGSLYDNNPVEGYLWLFGFTLSPEHRVQLKTLFCLSGHIFQIFSWSWHSRPMPWCCLCSPRETVAMPSWVIPHRGGIDTTDSTALGTANEADHGSGLHFCTSSLGRFSLPLQGLSRKVSPESRWDRSYYLTDILNSVYVSAPSSRDLAVASGSVSIYLLFHAHLCRLRWDFESGSSTSVQGPWLQSGIRPWEDWRCG